MEALLFLGIAGLAEGGRGNAVSAAMVFPLDAGWFATRAHGVPLQE